MSQKENEYIKKEKAIDALTPCMWEGEKQGFLDIALMTAQHQIMLIQGIDLCYCEDCDHSWEDGAGKLRCSEWGTWEKDCVTEPEGFCHKAKRKVKKNG